MEKLQIASFFSSPKIMEDEIPHLFKRYHFIYWLIAIFHPFWGLVLNFFLPQFHDPIIHRLVVASLAIASDFFSRKYNFSYPKRYALIMVNLILLNLAMLKLTATTGNHPMYVIGVYLTFIATGMLFDNEKTLFLFVGSIIIPLILFNGMVINSTIPISFIYFLFASGTLINYFGLRDRFQLITKLRNLNLAIKQKSLELDQERINTFNASKLASLGDMAGNIAHEINNPLFIINGFANKLKRSILEEEKKQESLRTLEQIINTANRIAVIIKKLKSLARSKINDEMLKVSPIELVESVSQFFEERLKSEEINYHYNFNEEELKNVAILCRQSEISQILINLMNNAIYAAKENFQEEKRVVLSCVCDNEFIYFTVEDSGVGISKDIADKIYEPFFTTKQEIKAIGLGLSISKTVVEDNHGTIYLDNSAKCTMFVIKLKKIKLQIAS